MLTLSTQFRAYVRHVSCVVCTFALAHFTRPNVRRWLEQTIAGVRVGHTDETDDAGCFASRNLQTDSQTTVFVTVFPRWSFYAAAELD